MTKKIGDDKYFYSKIVVIGIPVVIQNLLVMGLNLIDTMMIGALGEEELAGVGVANQVYFLYTVLLFGLFSGGSVIAAQFFGIGNDDGVRKVVGINLVAAVILSFVTIAISLTLAPQIMGLFSDEVEVINHGVDYLYIASFSFFFAGISFVISYSSRVIQKMKMVTTINAVALCINVILNYVLIFGTDNIPAMGVSGAAVATLIARIFELLMLLLYIYKSKNHYYNVPVRHLFGFSRALLFKILKISLPVVFTEIVWSLSVTLTFAIFGQIGTSALAVVQATRVLTEMLQSVFFGVGNAGAMIIGYSLGRGEKEEAFYYANKALKLSVILLFFVVSFLLIISNPITAFYNFDVPTKELLLVCLRIMSLSVVPKMFSYLFTVGIFRAGGDTKYAMVLEIVFNTIIQVIVAYVTVVILKLDLAAAMIAVESVMIIKVLLCLPRFYRKKWMNTLVD